MNDMPAALSAYLTTMHLHQTIQESSWIVATVQSVHILCVAIVFSSSLIVALRALRVTGTDWTPAQWGDRLNGWVGAALLILLATGALLIVGEPERSLNNSVFQIKMVLVIVTSLLFWTLGQRLRRSATQARPGLAEQGLGALIVLLWVAVISAGRWIAYTAF